MRALPRWALFLAVFVAACIILAILFSGNKSDAAQPVQNQQQAKTSDFVEHIVAGNPQGFAVTCWWDGSVHWLPQGSDSAFQCPFTKVTQWYVPTNFSLCIRPRSQPMTGCQTKYSGGFWWGAPAGQYSGWTVHN